jgi:hypothetical protein
VQFVKGYIKFAEIKMKRIQADAPLFALRSPVTG